MDSNPYASSASQDSPPPGWRLIAGGIVYVWAAMLFFYAALQVMLHDPRPHGPPDYSYLHEPLFFVLLSGGLWWVGRGLRRGKRTTP